MISPDAFGDQQGRGPIPRGKGWYRSPVLIIPLLVCCWPVGLALMWLFAPWAQRTKVIVSGVIAGLLVIGTISRAVSPPQSTVSVAPTAVMAAQPAAAPPAVAPPAATQPAPTMPPPTSPPEPTAQPASIAERLVITGAGAEGVNMRAEPSTTGARVKLLKDGASVEIAGEDREAGGRTWRNIKDVSDGAVGWVASEFVATQGVQAAAPAAKPGGASPDVQEYLDWLGPKTIQAGQSLQALSSQSELASKTPTLIANAEWRTKTVIALGFLKNAGQEMQTYPKTVPQQARQLDTIVKGLGADLDYIANEYAAGLDQVNAQRIQNAVTRMNGVSPKAQAATAEINRLKGQ